MSAAVKAPARTVSPPKGFKPATETKITAVSADAALIAMLEEAKRQMRAVSPHASPGAPIVSGPWAVLMHNAAAIPATTPEGLRAKAEIAAGWMTFGCPADGIPNPAQAEQHVAWSLLQDLMSGCVMLPSLPSPDAALLEACADHVRLFGEEERALAAMRAYDIKDDSPEADAAEEKWDAAREKSTDLLGDILDTPANTYGGAAANAKSVMLYWTSLGLPTAETVNFEERGTLSVLADLERIAGAP